MELNVQQRARRVRILILDVDGVLTDGGLYYDLQGQISKRFNVQDGLGIKLAQAAGLEVGVITGLESEAVKKRILELGIKRYYAGFLDKRALIDQICQDVGCELTELAYLGDDWVDAGPLSMVGLPMAVANAQPEIKEMSLWVSSLPGGGGAVREAIRFILLAQNKLQPLWQQWLEKVSPR